MQATLSARCCHIPDEIEQELPPASEEGLEVPNDGDVSTPRRRSLHVCPHHQIVFDEDTHITY